MSEVAYDRSKALALRILQVMHEIRDGQNDMATMLLDRAEQDAKAILDVESYEGALKKYLG